MSIWEQALGVIHSRVTAENFSTYFRPLRCADELSDRIVLEVTDAFFGDWVRDHYQDLIHSAVESITGRPFEIEIVTATSPPPVPKTEASPAETPSRKDEPAVAPVIPITQGAKKKRLGAFDLNPHYRFDTFVVGPSNEMAHAASMAVANDPARAFNPLFIYGGTGLGKTHLLHAVARRIYAERPDAAITYISAEEFTNEVIKSIQRQEMDAFRARFRDQCDVLLMDDVHILAGKERTQEEFFYTFNALHGAQKQIILTCDRTPQEIPRLEARLRSRFQWGLIADIRPPQLETRVAILQAKAERDGIALPDDVAFYLARLVRANVRELEGALVRMCAYASFNRRELSVPFAQDCLRDLVDHREQALTSESIIKLVAEHFDVRESDLKGPRRHRTIAHPRGIAMYLCRKHTQASFPQIGRAFGGKDHTTVMAAYRKVGKACNNTLSARSEIEAIERKLPI